MSTYRIALNKRLGKLIILAEADALPAGYVSLGTTEHGGPDDKYGYEGNHTLYHHLRDVLYKEGIENMAAIVVPPKGTLPNDPVVTIPTLNLSATKTDISATGVSTITATLSTPVTWACSVPVVWSGSAINGMDYTPMANVIFIPPGQTTGSVLVRGTGKRKTNSSITATAGSNPSYYTLGSNKAVTVNLAGTASEPETPNLPLKFANLHNQCVLQHDGNWVENGNLIDSRFGRYPIILGSGDMSKLGIMLSMLYVQSNEIGKSSQPITYQAVAIEMNGVTVPVTFNGQRSVSIPAGTAEVVSDLLDPSAFGLTVFNRGRTGFIRFLEKVNDTNGKFPISSLPSDKMPSGFQLGMFASAANNSGVSAVTVDGTGTANLQNNVWGSAFSYGPILIGRPKTTSFKSMLFLGDSHIVGGNDNASVNGTAGIHGYARRALYNNGNSVMAGCSIGVSGGRSNAFFNGNGITDFMNTYFKYATDAFISYDTNDVANGGPTGNLDDMKSKNTKIAEWLKARGIKTIGRAFLFPRTTSTDGFVTVQNQSYIGTNWNPANGDAKRMNDWFAAQVGTLYDYTMPSPVVRASNDFYKWDAPNGVAYTNDGTHLVGPSSALVATVLRQLFNQKLT